MRSGAVGAILILAICAVPARANESGRIGYSGKQNIICNACHSGGTRPAVRFEGPTEVASGATATFRFVVTSENPTLQKLSGFNVAASAGSLRVITGQKERLSSGELTHSDPKAIDVNHESAWQFDWIAPEQTGPQTLYGAGNSVNGNGNPTGDRAAATTVMIDVVAAGASQTATATSTPLASSVTPTSSPSPSDTATSTQIPTATMTATVPAVPTETAPVATPSATATASPSLTATETATATRTPSPTGAMPTEFPSVTASATEAVPTACPSVTASPTTALPTASPSLTATLAAACDGDCDGNHRVSVDELVTGVNIALDRAPLAGCAVLDRDGDNRVTVAELVSAVRRALMGC